MSDKQRTCLTGVIAKLYRNRGPKTSSGLLTELKEKNRTNGKRDTRHLEKRELLVEIQPAYESEYDDVRDDKDGRRDGDILRLEALDEEHKTDEVDAEPADIERQLWLLDPEFKNDITERDYCAAEKKPDKSSHNSVTVIVASKKRTRGAAPRAYCGCPLMKRITSPPWEGLRLSPFFRLAPSSPIASIVHTQSRSGLFWTISNALYTRRSPIVASRPDKSHSFVRMGVPSTKRPPRAQDVYFPFIFGEGFDIEDSRDYVSFFFFLPRKTPG